MPAHAKDPEVEIRRVVAQFEKNLRVAIAKRAAISERPITRKIVRQISEELVPSQRFAAFQTRRRVYLEVGLPVTIAKEFKRMVRENEWTLEEVIEVMIRRALRENVNLVFDIVKIRQKRRNHEE